MQDLSFRQVHLDFHTSEAIDGIGSRFSRRQFQEALKLGHVDSVTVFAKCHHGWAYFPSDTNEMHPGLHFDLLGEMVSAAHEIGVRTPIYLSAGIDEKMARRHPEWLIRDADEKTSWAPDFMHPGYHQLCMNSPYLDYLIRQIEEVVRKYDADGIFLDIVGVKKCYCQNCIASLRREGKDPRDEQALHELWENTYFNYLRRVNAAIHQIKPSMPVFHNGGHICRGRRDMIAENTHLEIESLPTGGWGYDHFPLSARYVQPLGVQFLGMTGKFHTSWGEFGGFKHPNALRYETALCLANGGRCSVGDQLHPQGRMDEVTYRLIGAAYKEVEAKEAWCKNTESVTDVALLSTEAVHHAAVGGAKADIGAYRILSEGKVLFDVIDTESDFSKYKVLILPDSIRIAPEWKDKLAAYLAQGGRLLASGESGLGCETDGFAVELGAKWIASNPYRPDYFHPAFSYGSLQDTAYVRYSRGQKIELENGRSLGERENPYFNRDVFTFCSHQHAPDSFESGGPGMTEGRDGIYIAWDIFEEYATVGSLNARDMALYALDRLLGPSRTLETSLPAQGIVTLMHQRAEKRYVEHLLYASPVRRGSGVEIIEDILPLCRVRSSVRLPVQVRRVYLAPQMRELPFTQENGRVEYVVPEMECHQMVVLEY